MKKVSHNLRTRCKACMHATNSEIRIYFIIVVVVDGVRVTANDAT